MNKESRLSCKLQKPSRKRHTKPSSEAAKITTPLRKEHNIMNETINPSSGIKNVIDINDQIKDKVLLITGGTGSFASTRLRYVR